MSECLVIAIKRYKLVKTRTINHTKHGTPTEADAIFKTSSTSVVSVCWFSVRVVRVYGATSRTSQILRLNYQMFLYFCMRMQLDLTVLVLTHEY